METTFKTKIMKTVQKKTMQTLFERWSGHKPTNIEALPAHGSAREYYRLVSNTHTAIGAYNDDRAENKAFLEFSRHFFKTGLPVPEIYAEELKKIFIWNRIWVMKPFSRF